MRYVVADPSLKSYSGHCFEYMRSLRAALIPRGDEVVLVGNRDMEKEFSAKTHAIPVITYWCDARPLLFPVDPSSKVGMSAIRSEHEKSLIQDLNLLDEKISFRKDDVFIINTIRHWGLRGVVRWAEQFPADKLPKISIILHFTAFPDPEKDDGTAEFYRDAFLSLKQSAVRDRFTLLADSEELIEEYALFTDIKVDLAPIPHCDTAILKSERQANGAQRIKLAYLGEARLNKGFHLLPVLAERIHAKGLQSTVELHIQSFIFDPSQDFYRHAMARLFYENIVFYPEQLTAEEYANLLDRADAILLPYRIENYHSQTSGVFAEALAKGKPIITSRGTWMAAQVKQFKCGALFAPDDSVDFCNAVFDVIDNFDAYVAAAKDAAMQWGNFHSAENLLSIIGKDK